MTIARHISSIEKLIPGQMSATEQSQVLSTLESVLQYVSEQAILIQSLRDEINRLKGEDGKPTILGKNQKEKSDDSSNISSESARKTADLPVYYESGSDYTQELKGHICLMKFSLGLSIPKIGEFL